jgi:hypothetical protein
MPTLGVSRSIGINLPVALLRLRSGGHIQAAIES